MPDRLPEASPLAPDAICLHIGVHKTGTTALQSAFAAARADLAGHGVLYPGGRTAHHGPAMAVLGRSWGWKGRGGEQPDPAVFDRLARQARHHDGRVLISSEQFCEADDRAAARVVEGLTPGRTHVVVALRSLARLLPSSWQQYLKYGQTLPYDRWLETILDPGYAGKVTPTFWRRNDHGAVVGRWASLLGPDRVTVLIVEDVPPPAIFHAFEELLDLPRGLLQVRMDPRANRSMTAQESELLRRLNVSLARSLSWRDYEELVRGEVASGLVASRTPGPGEPRLHTPAWALDVAAARGRAAAEVIAASGVTVLGDLDALGRAAEPSSPVPDEVLAALPMDAALAVVIRQIEARAGTSRRNPARALLRRVRWRLEALRRGR